MPITVEQLPAYLRDLGGKVAREAPRKAAYAMGAAFQGHVVRSMHGASPSPPGTPPARVSGALARSIRTEPATMIGDYSAQSSVSPHIVYARIQQFGGDIRPRHLMANGQLGFLRWEDKGGLHFSRHVHLPPRPYMVVNQGARTACHNAAVSAVRSYLAGG